MKRFVLISMTVLALTGCRGEHPAEEQAVKELPPVKVNVMTVLAQEAPKLTEVVGTVQPVDRAEIAAKVTGTIDKISVVLGSRVKAGDELIKINAGEISAKLIQAKAQLEQARRNLEREKKLLKKNAATPETVKSLEETFKIAEAAHREAAIMLSYATITAPFDGQITQKNANVGDLATPGVQLLQLEDNSNLQVVISVPEALVLQLKLGDTLPIHIPAADVDIQGTVSQIAPAADPLSRTSAVKLDIKESNLLRSGQFARVALPGTRKDTLFVPTGAVQQFGQMDKIFVVQDNIAHLRLIKTGAMVDQQVEILSGLEPGEKVVAALDDKIVDGQKVIIEQ